MHNSDLDRSIGAVARRLTAHEPSADFSSRVVARLDEKRGAPWFWIGGIIATAGAIAIAVVASMDRRIDPSLHRSIGTSTATGASTAIGTSAAITASKPGVPNLNPNPRTQNPRTLEPRSLEPSAERLAWESRALAALAGPEAPRAISNIQPEPLEIRPLVTPALSVPAIGEEEDK